VTVERRILVEVDATNPIVPSLVEDIRSFAARAEKAMPGERVDVVRYEAVSTQLETLAAAALARGARSIEIPDPTPESEGHCFIDGKEAVRRYDAEFARRVPAANDAEVILVELSLPLTPGIVKRVLVERPGPPPVAETWAADEGVTGRRAVAARFRAQLEGVLANESGAALSPSGVSNSVLTEVLREFVARTDGPRVDAPVIYRDGSFANPFPLRSLELASEVSTMAHVMRFALLSIRHAEMDAVVDGAWLRNTEVSRPRPAGETDSIVYEISRRQLSQLTQAGPTLVYLYQTGFEAAVVAFYRAVVHHLLESPHTLAVVPMFFRRTAPTKVRSVAGYEQQATFVEGRPWTL
jgi:hypothetical protein